jgi:hypothetical protein
MSGADPLVRGRRPRRPVGAGSDLDSVAEKPAWGRARLVEERVQGDPRGPGGPPHKVGGSGSVGSTQ